MARYLIFGRKKYAEPLARLGEADTDAPPTVEEGGVGTDWLELVAIPEPDVVWIVCDGEVVADTRNRSVA